MSENEQGTFKPQFGAELNIESIIGAPLVAASKANVMMLTGQAQFLIIASQKRREATCDNLL